MSRYSILAWLGTGAALAACAVHGIVADRVAMDAGFRVDATLNGTPVRLCLDTGAQTGLLAIAAAERAGLTVRSSAKSITDSTGASRIADGEVDYALRLGSTTFRGPAVCLRPPVAFGDGLIGFDLLRLGAWLFDAPRLVVHMAPAAGAEQLVAAGYRVSERLDLGPDEWRPTVTVRLDDTVDVTLFLDTGAEATSLPAAVVDALRLPSGDELARQQADERAAAMAEELRRQGVQAQVQVVPGEGNVGVHGVIGASTRHHLRRLTLGGRTFVDLVVNRREGEGLLGRDVLGKCPWLLHGPRRELWLLEPR